MRYYKQIGIFCFIFFGLFVNLYGFQVVAKDSIDKKITPKGAMIRSLILPGWGQLYVKKPVKSLLFFSLEAYHGYMAYKLTDEYHYVDETIEMMGDYTWSTLDLGNQRQTIIDSTGFDIGTNARNLKRMRNKYYWWCLGFYLIGMLDSYVDAHLISFPNKNIELSAIIDRREFGINLSCKLGR